VCSFICQVLLKFGPGFAAVSGRILTYIMEAIRHANFDFDPTTWVVWVNGQFAIVFFLSFLSFFVFFAKPTGRTVSQIWTNEGSKRVIPRKEVPFGV